MWEGMSYTVAVEQHQDEDVDRNTCTLVKQMSYGCSIQLCDIICIMQKYDSLVC